MIWRQRNATRSKRPPRSITRWPRRNSWRKIHISMVKRTVTFDMAATSITTWGWQINISRCSTTNRQRPPSSTLQSTQAIITIEIKAIIIQILIHRKPEHHWIRDWRITRTYPEFCLEAWWRTSCQLWCLKEAKDRWKRLIKPDNTLYKLWMVQAQEPGRASAPRWWLPTHKETSTAKWRAAKHLRVYHRSSRTSLKIIISNSILETTFIQIIAKKFNIQQQLWFQRAALL